MPQQPCHSAGPKYDNEHPSYPGFERDVFKTVSDYFYSLPQPLLTYELYELFINVLGRWSHQGYFLSVLTENKTRRCFKTTHMCGCVVVTVVALLATLTANSETGRCHSVCQVSNRNMCSVSGRVLPDWCDQNSRGRLK